MGHVDHGKTSLLDAIRHTGVAEGEAGGITQAIGASQVKINGRTITFIDTPGHETFTAMRARGAKVTDIVILIVAADDGVMPQTVGVHQPRQGRGRPIIVAVNKIDKPGANPDKVRQELTEYGVIPEEWGGQNMFVNISAKQKIGIDELLETVLLQADVLELKANPDTFRLRQRPRGQARPRPRLRGHGPRDARHAAHRRRARGRHVLRPRPRDARPQGQLRRDPPAPRTPWRSSACRACRWPATSSASSRTTATPATSPTKRALKARIEEQNRVKHVTLENLFDTHGRRRGQGAQPPSSRPTSRARSRRSRDSLDKMDQSEVRINTIHSAVGAITETDVVLRGRLQRHHHRLRRAPRRPRPAAAAERDGVEIRTYSVIYKAIEDIDAARIGMLKPTEIEVQTGSAEVRGHLQGALRSASPRAAWSRTARSPATTQVRLVRDGIVVYDGKIASLRRYKDDVKSVKAGFECGIGLENFQDVKPGDIIEGYRIDQVARTE